MSDECWHEDGMCDCPEEEEEAADMECGWIDDDWECEEIDESDPGLSDMDGE